MNNSNHKHRTQPLTAAEIDEMTYGDNEIDDDTWGKDTSDIISVKKTIPTAEYSSFKDLKETHSDSSCVGKIFKGSLKGGIPIAVIKDGYIYKGFIPSGSQPIGNLTNGQVFSGFLKGGNPVATITEKHICRGLLKHSNFLGIVSDGHVYHYFMRGNPIVSYSGTNEDEALAAAFLLGLFDK